MSDESKLRFARGAAGVLGISAAAVLGVVLVTSANGSVDVVVPTGPAVATDGTPPQDERPARCVIAHGDPTDRGWIRSGGGSKAQRAVTTALHARFDDESTKSNPKGHPTAQLRRGLVGEAYDFDAHEIVVVIDPALVDMVDLEKDLRAVADRKLPTSDLQVRVQAGCHASRELAEAHEVIVGQKWRPADVGGFGFHLDPHTSTYKVGILPEGGRALKAELGDLVTIDAESRIVAGAGRGL